MKPGLIETLIGLLNQQARDNSGFSRALIAAEARDIERAATLARIERLALDTAAALARVEAGLAARAVEIPHEGTIGQ